MKLKVSAGGVPPGNYAAKFAGTETTQNNEYGPGMRWKFIVTQGPQAGQVASRVTSTTPSSKNACGKLLMGLLGRALTIDEEIDIDTLVGRAYLIVVVPTDGGGSRVDAVIAAPPAA